MGVCGFHGVFATDLEPSPIPLLQFVRKLCIIKTEKEIRKTQYFLATVVKESR